jgi:formamidopyrimidine-DNA glycosylase
MPTLVEVEVVRRDLDREVVGRRIKDVEVRPGSKSMKVIKRHGRRKEFQDLLTGARIDRVARLGTWLRLELDNDFVLAINLRSSARLSKRGASEQLAPYTHIVIGFTIGGQLRLSDPAHSAEVLVVPQDEVASLYEEGAAKLDPFDGPLPWQQFSGLLEDAKSEMKELLMDERFICGLGDIYSDEILFGAGLRYDRGSHELSAQDVRRLYRALHETLQDALKARGTTWAEHDFEDLLGRPGQYQLDLKVYDREGEACRRCRSSIVGATVLTGYTYFCPQCQS